MEQEWTYVSRRKRRGKCRPQPPSSTPLKADFNATAVREEEVVQPVAEVSQAKQQQLIQRIHAIIDALRSSRLLHDALRLILSHYHSTNALGLTLIGYGLGSFCASSNARHQFAFFVALHRALVPHFQLVIEIFDPAMNKSDAVIATHFHVQLLLKNEHARRRIHRPTVFFMPHCAQVLYQNVLACNWGPALKHLIIIGNRFSAYTDRIWTLEEQQAPLLGQVVPYVHELPLSCGVSASHNDYALYEAAFNDLSVQWFPSSVVDHALPSNTSLGATMAALAHSND